MRAAVYDAVSHDIDLRSGGDGTRFSVARGAQQVPDKLLARGNRQFFFEGGALGVSYVDRRGVSAPFDLPLPQRSRGTIRKRPAHFVQKAFLAAGSRVEHENFHSW